MKKKLLSLLVIISIFLQPLSAYAYNSQMDDISSGVYYFNNQVFFKKYIKGFLNRPYMTFSVDGMSINVDYDFSKISAYNFSAMDKNILQLEESFTGNAFGYYLKSYNLNDEKGSIKVDCSSISDNPYILNMNIDVNSSNGDDYKTLFYDSLCIIYGDDIIIEKHNNELYLTENRKITKENYDAYLSIIDNQYKYSPDDYINISKGLNEYNQKSSKTIALAKSVTAGY